MTRIWKLQARVVDVLKRHAIALLHRTRRGEVVLLSQYLWAEEGVEGPALGRVLELPSTQRMAQQLEKHLDDERRHARLLRSRLGELGGAPRAMKIDPISRAKLRALAALAERGASDFRSGYAVPFLAVAWRMEVVALRIYTRHISVLERQRGERVAGLTEVLLRRIVGDERRHVRDCQHALDQLVEPGERPALARLVRRIDSVDRAFAVTGALGLVVLAWLVHLARWPAWLWPNRDTSEASP